MSCDNYDILDPTYLADKARFSKPNFVLIDEFNSQVAAWAAVICSILGFFGNTLTIIVFLRKASLRNHATTPFLLSLAFSDLVFSSFNLPFTADRYFHRTWRFKWCSCQLFAFFYYSNVSISALSMAGVALNRYLGLFYPHKMSSWFSMTKSFGVLTLFWAYSLGMMMLPFGKVWGRLGYDPQIFSCTMLTHEGKNPMTALLSLGFGLPMAIITFCYISIYVKVKSTGREIRSIMDDCNIHLTRQIQKRESQITKMTLMVWLGYLICFCPTFLIMTVDPMPPNRNYPGLHVAGYVIFWCSSFINPVIYVVSNKYYRKALQEVVCCDVENLDRKSRALSLPSRRSSKSSRRSNGSIHPEQIELNPAV